MTAIASRMSRRRVRLDLSVRLIRKDNGSRSSFVNSLIKKLGIEPGDCPISQPGLPEVLAMLGHQGWIFFNEPLEKSACAALTCGLSRILVARPVHDRELRMEAANRSVYRFRGQSRRRLLSHRVPLS